MTTIPSTSPTIRNPDMPATPKQIDYLRNLLRTRQSGIESQHVHDVLQAWEQAGILTKGFVSAKIEETKALPYVTHKQAEPGYYTHDGEMYVVVRTKDGKRTYANRLVNTGTEERAHWSWQYDKGMGRRLADLTPLTVEEAAKFGHLHGQCVICLRPLTTPASVEAGIGPVCAKKLAR